MSTLSTLSTSDTPADTLITKFNDNFANLNTDKLEASDIAGKQDTLVSWTNIKTINSVSVLGSGDLTIPALTDGDKGDITLSSSGTVWTIDNGVVTNSKLANMDSWTIKGCSTVWSGSPEDLTGTQVTALLDTATTSLKGLLSTTDKIKLDWLSNEWTLITSSSYTAWGTYNSGTLTSYNLYKIVITGTSTAWSTQIRMRVNSDATASSYNTYLYSTTSINNSSLVDDNFRILNHNVWSWYPFYSELIMTSATCRVTNVTGALWDWEILNWGNKSIAVTSIQLSTIVAISGNIKIYGKNF